MVRTLTLIALFAASALPALAGSGRGEPGRAESGRVIPAEERTYAWSGNTPQCEDPAVLGKISRRFHEREAEYWQSGLTIGGFDRVELIAIRPWRADFIPRRYCTARVILNDAHGIPRHRRIDYSVAENLGIIGTGFGVDWCVQGLDRHYAHAPDCKMARP